MKSENASDTVCAGSVFVRIRPSPLKPSTSGARYVFDIFYPHNAVSMGIICFLRDMTFFRNT